MFVPSRPNAELLSNLKVVLDQRLLAQSAFFEDEVLGVLFGVTEVQWVKPGTPDVASERLIRPTRIARIRFEEGDRFAGMKVDVGANHKCLDRRPHPARAGAFVPAHTYDSGYIFIRMDACSTMTVGEVRQAFGWNFGKLDPACRSPISIYCQGRKGLRGMPSGCMRLSSGQVKWGMKSSAGWRPIGVCRTRARSATSGCAWSRTIRIQSTRPGQKRRRSSCSQSREVS